MLHSHERPSRTLHQIFPARARSRGYVTVPMRFSTAGSSQLIEILPTSSLLVWSFCFSTPRKILALCNNANVNTAQHLELLTKNRPQPHAGRLFDARRVGTLHVRVQRGSRDGARSFRRPHGRQDRCGAGPGTLRMGSGVRGGGYRVDVGVFFSRTIPFHNHIHPFSALRKFVANERADMWIVILFFLLRLQLCGDGGDTEERHLPSGTCVAETA